MFPNNKRKPLGEFAWVTEGKTEYYAQLLKPISETVSGGDEECEVQWTHNGLIEWVTVDQIRVESTSKGGRRRTPRKSEASTSSQSSKLKKAEASPIKAKISPKKRSKQPSKEDSPKKSKNKTLKEKRQVDESVESTISDQPNPKKQRISSIQDSSAGLISTLSSAKDAVVSGIMGFYKGFMGSESS